jgi:hypothetical protein
VGCRIAARDTKTFAVGERERVSSHFFDRKLRAFGCLLEPRWREIAAWNSAMDGVPNACGRFRDSGKPVTGLSRPDLSTRLVVP